MLSDILKPSELLIRVAEFVEGKELIIAVVLTMIVLYCVFFKNN